MRVGKILAECLNSGKDYEREWRSEIGKELLLHLRARKFMNRLSQEDYDTFVNILKNVNLGEFNRDYPLKNLGMFANPRLVGFMVKNFYKIF